MRIVLSILMLVALFCPNLVRGQQPFHFRYLLHTSLNGTGTFVEKNTPAVGVAAKAHVNTGQTISSNIKPDEPIYTLEDPAIFTIRPVLSTVKTGKIQINDSHDTLFLTPWYEPVYAAGRRFGSPITSDKSYYYVPTWATNRIVIPFVYTDFFVTSLPFRVNLHTKEFQNEFLNANIAYLLVLGKTKFYHSKFLEPRHTYWGVGPYIGASTIKENDKDAFGFNYGINGIRAIRNIDLTVALGAETDFKSKANDFNPYIGIGIGIKLIEFYEPETKPD